MWNLVDAWIWTHGFTVSAQLIDRYHVDERLAELAEAIAVDDPTRRELFDGWRTQLDHSDIAFDRICRRLDELGDHQTCGSTDGEAPPRYWERRACRGRYGERAATAWGHLKHLNNNRRYLRYAAARRQGLGVGSGVTEGACKSVVTLRFKRGGQRWFESGLSPCLQLRALHLDGRLRPCFDHVVRAANVSLRAP